MNKRNIIVKTISYTLTVLMAAAFIFFVDMGWNVKEVQAEDTIVEFSAGSGSGECTLNEGDIQVKGYKYDPNSGNSSFLIGQTAGGSKTITISAIPSNTYEITKVELSTAKVTGANANYTNVLKSSPNTTIVGTSSKTISSATVWDKITFSDVKSSTLTISNGSSFIGYSKITVYYGPKHVCSESEVTEENKIAKKDATCLEDGYNAYWICSCGKVYASDDFSTSYDDEETWKNGDGKLDATDHSWKTGWSYNASNHWHECGNENCPVTDESQMDGYAAHNWIYTADGNTVTAKCSVVGCYYYANGATMTLSAPTGTSTGTNPVYTGSSIPATISDWSLSESMTLAAKPGTDSIKYSGQDVFEETYGPTITPPTNAGTYTVTTTVGTAEITDSYTIDPKDINGLVVEPISDTKFNNDQPNDSETDTTVTPVVVVNDNGTALTKGVDYELSGVTEASEVGTYKITVEGKGNYSGKQEDIPWNIVDRTFGSGEIVVDNYSGVYDAKKHTIDVQTIPSLATIKYSKVDGGPYDSDTPFEFSDATNGSITIYYQVTKTGHVTATGSATVTIDKAPLTIVPISGQAKEYSDPDPELKYTVDSSGYQTGDNDDNVTLSGNLAYKDQDPDGDLEAIKSYEIIGTSETTGADLITAENYKITVQPGITFEVKRKQIDFDSDTATVTLDFDEKPCTGEEINNDITSIVINGQTLIRDVDFVVSGETSATVFGPHTITITGIGKYDGTANVVWNLTDNTSPDGDITISETSIKKPFDITAFDWFNKKSQTVTITASDRDSGVDKVYYYASDVIMTEDEVKNISEWTEYAAPFEINPDIKVVVYAKIADKSGNLTFLGSDGLVLDGTDPVIEGIENGMTYCIDAKEITVTDGNLEKVTVNGDEVTLVDGKYTLEAANKKYTVIATDKAGNVTAVVVTINDHHTYGEYVPNNNGNTQSAGTEEAHCIYCDNIDIREIKGTKVDVPVEKSNEESSKIGTGIVKVSVNKDKNCPQATIDNFSTDLATSLLTPAEIQEVADGASAYIFLDIVNIDDKVSSSDKTSVEKIAQGITSGNAKIGMYLDISLFKRLSTALKTDRITNTNGKPIKITLAIPQSLINTNEDINRRYYIARVHDGKASLLDTEYNSDNKTVSCSSGLFSTYALLYVDTAVEKDDITVEYHSSNNKVETYTIASPVLLANSLNANVLAPKTGDDFNIVGWITALFAVILLSGGIVLYERRKSK